MDESLIRQTHSLGGYLAALSFAIGFLFAPGPAWGDQDRLGNEVRQFHSFLQAHPKITNDLRSNPKLVNSKKYLDKHDDLESFLKRHPRVKQEIVNHPARVFGNYYREDYARSPHR
jgi:hypothetical protein